MKAVTLRLTKLLRSFKRDRDGASAIEFAILAPLLIALYLGCVEITDGIAADRKVTLTAGALANLTSQSQTITVAGMTNILNASAAVIKPYSVGNLAGFVSPYVVGWLKDTTHSTEAGMFAVTAVLILGDARNNNQDPNLGALHAINQRARRTFWLNPEHAMRWGLGDSIAPTYADVVEMHECCNVDQLTKFITRLLPV